MSELERLIAQEIASSGPMPVSRYMTLCLSHPKFGYYTSAAAIGESGDFLTAPEVSQMFGELIGIWVRTVFEELGSPGQFRIVEFGPGHGTLMADCLRSVSLDKRLMRALQIELIEISPIMRKRQAAALAKYADLVKWSDSMAADGPPTVVIGNEFLDALPIEIFAQTTDGLAQRHVRLNGDALEFADIPLQQTANAFLPLAMGEGEVFEISLTGLSVVKEIASSVYETGGAVLFIDYGYVQSPKRVTLQALKQHEKVHPLAEPGQADLTSLVNFSLVGQVMGSSGLMLHEPVDQADFLLNLGLLERAAALGQGKDESLQKKLQRQVNRLVAPDEMGTLFKVLAASTHGLNLVGLKNAI